MRRMAFLVPVLLLLAEIFLVSRVASAVGAGTTVLLLLAGVAAGALVIRYEGARLLTRAVRSAQATAGPEPGLGPVTGATRTGRQAADAGVVVLGGALLIFPGFISDALGLLCVLPFTRPLVRRALGATLAGQIMRRTRVGAVVSDVRAATGGMRGPGGPGVFGPGGGKVVPGEVVHGEVVQGEVVERRGE